MLSINLDDVMQVLTNVRSYLIAFGVVLALAIIVMVAVRKLPKAKKKMIRAQSGLAILLALTCPPIWLPSWTAAGSAAWHRLTALSAAPLTTMVLTTIP